MWSELTSVEENIDSDSRECAVDIFDAVLFAYLISGMIAFPLPTCDAPHLKNSESQLDIKGMIFVLLCWQGLTRDQLAWQAQLEK